MITKFKIFENSREPQIGDYAVCEYEDDNYNRQIYNKIGVITYKNDKNDQTFYTVKYDFKLYDDTEDALPGTDELDWIYEEEILFFSKNKQDCETFLEANKYNL